MKRIYLDYNATTPIAPEVREAMLPFLAEHFGNPSSDHVLGRAVEESIRDARERLAHVLGADPEEILFTSGGTESNNLALIGAMRAGARPGKNHLVISSIEHPATVQPARFLESEGFKLTVVNPNNEGVVTPEAVAAALRPETVLVSLMHANNEIGTIQPIRRVVDVCHDRGILVHTDAAQSLGKIRVDLDELGVDLLSIAGHKIYAPKGIGALFVKNGVMISPVLLGAAQESGLRPGTENVAGIVALGHAASLVHKDHDESCERLATLRDRLFHQLRDSINGNLGLNGENARRLPNTLSVNFPNIRGQDLLRQVPEVCASTGAACHSGAARMSDTLVAIGLSEEVAQGTVRLSAGRYTTPLDVDRAADLLISAWERMQ